MRMLSGVMLTLSLGMIVWFIRNDAADYAAFKLLTETAERQKRYLRWTLKSFLAFSVLTLLSLAILHRLSALENLPAEFQPIATSVQSLLPRQQLPGSGFLIGLTFSVVVGMIIGIAATKLFARKPNPFVLGDIQPLLPRNAAETACAALLSLNAGIGEELFFRLLLPLLLILLFATPMLAFAFAAILFGMMHLYQGPVGVAATTILGIALSALYLWTGHLWIVIAAHALLDLLGLVIRPSLTRLLTSPGDGIT